MARRLHGGVDDSTVSKEVDDGADSREIFDGKFCQPDGMSENLQGIRDVKVMQRFIYRRITVPTVIGDVSRPVATKNHSSNERLPSSACY
jgi:hypothetical protein